MLTSEGVANAVGALMGDNCIIADEGNTSGLFAPGATQGAPQHDWLCLTGGAIGDGLPMAIGASIACPDRQVICLEADGSAMYTNQALWTMARENCNVVVVLFANKSYAVLNMELSRVGAEPGGPKALEMLDLTNPEINFAEIAQGCGVPSERVSTGEAFVEAFLTGLAADGPYFIEAMVDPIGL